MLVDEQWILQDARDGVMNLMFTRDPGTGGTPSISDVWVLPADDRQPPDQAASLTGGTIGLNGWFRAAPKVTLQAIDNRAPAPTVRVRDLTPGTPGTWQDYTGPLTVTGDARHSYTYQACDATGNWSPVKTVQVNLDNTAPTTTATVVSTAGRPR